MSDISAAFIVPRPNWLRVTQWFGAFFKPSPTPKSPDDHRLPRWELWQRIGFCLLAVMLAHGVQLVLLRNAENAAMEAGKRQAELGVAATEVWLRRSLEDINFCLDLLQQRQIMEDTNSPRGLEIETILRDIVSKHRFGIWVAMAIDQQGQAMWTSTADGELHNKANRPSVRSLGPDPQRTYVSDPYFGLYTGRTMISFSRYLKHADGSPAGAASVSLDPIALSKNLLSMMTQKNQNVGVWRDGGEAIVLTGWGRGFMQPPLKLYPEITVPLEHQDAATFIFYSDILHDEVITSAKRLPDLGLLVTSHVNTTDVLAAVRAGSGGLIWAKDAIVGLLAVVLVMWRRQMIARHRIAVKLAAVTEKANRALALQAEIDRAMDILPGAIYRVRLYPDGRRDFQFVSRSVERVTGWPSEMLLQMQRGFGSIREVQLSAEERGKIYAKQVADSYVSVDARIRCRDGRVAWMRFSQQTVMVGDGYVDAVGLITDIEVERASVAAAIASARLVTLGEMASGMAHEISQPLAMMSLAAENAINALKVKGPEVAIERMQRIPDLAQRVRSIIDHLRLFARQQPNHQEPVNIQDVVDGAMLLVEGALRDASVQVDIRIQPNLPAVLAEQVMLEQVLMNLLLNARDAMAETAKADRRVLISAQLIGVEVQLAVEDTGGGIPENVMPRLFEPFFTTKPPGHGTGLGLSICHGVIRSFGGTIQATNHGLGARFTVLLNLANTVT